MVQLFTVFKTLLIAFECERGVRMRTRDTPPTPAASNCSIAGLEPLALRISAFDGYTLQKMKDPALQIQDTAQEGSLRHEFFFPVGLKCQHFL